MKLLVTEADLAVARDIAESAGPASGEDLVRLLAQAVCAGREDVQDWSLIEDVYFPMTCMTTTKPVADREGVVAADVKCKWIPVLSVYIGAGGPARKHGHQLTSAERTEIRREYPDWAEDLIRTCGWENSTICIDCGTPWVMRSSSCERQAYAPGAKYWSYPGHPRASDGASNFELYPPDRLDEAHALFLDWWLRDYFCSEEVESYALLGEDALREIAEEGALSGASLKDLMAGRVAAEVLRLRAELGHLSPPELHLRARVLALSAARDRREMTPSEYVEHEVAWGLILRSEYELTDAERDAVETRLRELGLLDDRDPYDNPGLPLMEVIAAHEANGGRWLVTSHFPPKLPFNHLAELRVRDGAVEARDVSNQAQNTEWELLCDFCNVVAAVPMTC